MKNQRNPEIRKGKVSAPKKLTNFPKALSRNQQDVYQYILMMVTGDFKSQEDTSDCIFSHLKNIMNNEMNTNVLKYASRFITTLTLLGNIHVYERFRVYLLPVFREKILDDFKQRMRPVWPIQQFCRELLFILAMWLPFDFYDQAKPSAFALTVKELNIHCQDFKFMTVDKIIIAYRIIKALGLDQLEENCVCEGCKFRKNGKHVHNQQGKDDKSKKKMRQRLYILQSKSNIRDDLYETGFEISFDEEMSELQNMIENKFKSYYSSRVPYQESIIFYRLRQKMEILEDDIEIVKGKYKKDKHQVAEARAEEIELKETARFQTPIKKIQFNAEELMTTGFSKKSRKLVSPSTDLKSVKSMSNLQLLLLEEEFIYKGYDFFEKVLKLDVTSLQKFKNSLLCFDEKIYLKKDNKCIIYCIALAKTNKIKIRVNFEGEEDALSQYSSVTLQNSNLNYDFNEEKYEFTLRIPHLHQPIRLSLCGQKTKQTFVLPLGMIKLLQPLPDSAIQMEKLTFKLSKTIKLQNKLITSYEDLISKLSLLEKLIEKARTNKIPRLFEGQKLKKKLQRRYRLFETQIFLTITNNQTQYIDLEILCLDKNIHRRNSCELLKEFIFLCSS